MTKKLNLLVVEDNPDFRTAASTYLSSKAGVSFAVNYAGGNASALLYLVERDEKWRNLPRFDGAIIDCFFPPSESATYTEFGERAIEKMLATNLTAQKLDAYEAEFAKHIDLDDELRTYVRLAGHLSHEQNPRKNPVVLACEQVSKVSRELGTFCTRDTLKLSLSHRLKDFKDYFPALRKAMKENPANQPLGILVAEECEKRKIPFVLATSTHHHDYLTQPIADYCQRNGWTLVDCSPGNPNEKAQTSFWERAYNTLAEKMEERK